MDNIVFWSNWSQILSLFAAIISIAVAIWTYRRSKQHRRLTCFFENIVSPIEIKKDSLNKDLEIKYKGQVISNLLIMRAHLENTGNTPLLKSDVIEAVTFVFDNDIEFLSHPKIIKTQPDNLKVMWDVKNSEESLKPNTAILDFMLLNPKESLTTEFMWSGGTTLPKVTSRIIGLTKIGVFTSDSALAARNAMNSMANAIVGLIVAFSAYVGATITDKVVHFPEIFQSIISISITFTSIVAAIYIMVAGLQFIKANKEDTSL